MRFSEIVSRSQAARIESMIGMNEASVSDDTVLTAYISDMRAWLIDSVYLQDILANSVCCERNSAGKYQGRY